jgi:UDP-glucuronate decarboxylase
MMNKLMEEDAITIANESINWEKLRKKTVLISGANGYVPQFFVHGLLKRNDIFGDDIKVIALCRNEKKAAERFDAYYGRTDFELLIQDVSEPILYSGDIDYIIHAASPAGVQVTMTNPLETFDANVIGCKNLLEVASDKNAMFLLLSSVDIYGEMDDSNRLTEDKFGVLDHVSIRNIYAASKRAAETLCICYANKGVKCSIVRPSQIMGAGISLDDERLHINFISQMIHGDEIILKGDGTPKRTFIYITDAIVGMLVVLLEGNTGEAYNVCTEKCEASVLEFAETMSSLVKDREIKITYDMRSRTSDPAVTRVVSIVCANSDKLKSLGWEPKVLLPSSCKRMMEYYGLKVK